MIVCDMKYPKEALDNVLEVANEKLEKMLDTRKSFEDTLFPLGHKLSPPTEINKLQKSIEILETYFKDV
jgi:uncharacterized protein YllA (UPF0747 family)